MIGSHARAVDEHARSQPTPSWRRGVCLFGSGTHEATSALPRRNIASIVKGAEMGVVRAIVVDARSADDFFRGCELLRTLYDDPHRPKRLLHPSRVIALIADGDVQAAFTLGRYGIGAVIEERSIDAGVLAHTDSERQGPSRARTEAGRAREPMSSELERRLARIAQSRTDELPLSTPLLAPLRPTRVVGLVESAPPPVAIGYRHAPETLDLLARYVRVLRKHAGDSTVFADVATLIQTMVAEGLTCQTNLAAKAGATHTGQFIGSFEFYRELRRTRYGRIPDHPRGELDMDVFIAVDEVLHEVLHLLFVANQTRAGIEPTSTLFAEELSVTWWQALIHNRVFPDWLDDRHILEINDDFLLSKTNAETRGFWSVGNVFGPYADYPWVPHVIARLPARASYIGERGDLAQALEALRSNPDAAFLMDAPREHVNIPIAFDSYPVVPESLRLV